MSPCQKEKTDFEGESTGYFFGEKRFGQQLLFEMVSIREEKKETRFAQYLYLLLFKTHSDR